MPRPLKPGLPVLCNESSLSSSEDPAQPKINKMFIKSIHTKGGVRPGTGGDTGLTRAGGPQQDLHAPGGTPGVGLGGSHPDRKWATPPPNSHQGINRLLLPAASNMHTWERLDFTDSMFQ